MNYLQPYKGKSTRHTCPSCKTKHSFTLYLSDKTHQPIHHTVGKCNREIKCAYHYPPNQYFTHHPAPSGRDEARLVSSAPRTNSAPRPNPISHLNPLSCPNPILHSNPVTHPNSKMHSNPISHLNPLSLSNAILHPNLHSNPNPNMHPNPNSRSNIILENQFDHIPFSYIENSLSLQSHFHQFLTTILTPTQIDQVSQNYALGTTKSNAVIFWQIDTQAQVRTGKIMQYNPLIGKRIKHQSGAIDWVHNKLKKMGELPHDFNLQQCFFGEHLLTLYPDKPVAIVESEKSAIIASAIFPDFIWLAAGSLNGLSIEKVKVLRGRHVTFCPDLGAYEKWSFKATEIKQFLNCEIKVSNLLEGLATEGQSLDGLDIADYIIEELIIDQKRV